MSGRDPLAAWRSNAFFVLGVSPRASRAEVERAGQRLLGLLALGSASAGHFDTPLGPASRDADSVRQALAALRDPVERVIHELWADISPSIGENGNENPRGASKAAGHAMGWAGKWAE
jgi:hypothetical protein